MQLEERIARLIAVGASAAANCIPCLDVNRKKALEAGADQRQIAEAIAIGKLVRQCAASKMDNFISEMEASVLAAVDGVSCDCGAPRRMA